jgi:cytochrome c oxidase subunit 3
MSQPHAPADSSKYFLPHGTPWPIIGSVALFSTMLGVVAWLNEWFGPELFALGLALLAVMFIGWFRTVIGENQQGVYNLDVDRSFRMGMMWFIFSEVMFFGAFFGALFYARTLSVPWIGGEGVKIFNKLFLYQGYDAGWPTNGPAKLGPRADGTFEVIPAFGVPALNTAILLTSGLTITIAHHALRAGHRGMLKLFLALTFLLGFLFVTLQAHEYGEAYTHKGLQLSTGIYGSTFFMLTGFHGLHVTIGAIMLTIIWLRTPSTERTVSFG